MYWSSVCWPKFIWDKVENKYDQSYDTERYDDMMKKQKWYEEKAESIDNKYDKEIIDTFTLCRPKLITQA